MSDDFSKKALIKIGSGNIARYSNNLVRRGADEIAHIYPDLLRLVTKKAISC